MDILLATKENENNILIYQAFLQLPMLNLANLITNFAHSIHACSLEFRSRKNIATHNIRVVGTRTLQLQTNLLNLFNPLID